MSRRRGPLNGRAHEGVAMNCRRYTLPGALLVCVFATGGHVAAASPYEELAAKLPPDTNCIMAADVQALFRSQFGADHKWQAKVANDFRSGLMNTPPSALRVVVGESFDYSSLQPRWRVKINQLSKDVTAERVAQKFGGTVDKVANLPVVVCPREQLFVNYSPTLVGEVNGIQRQELSRLLRTTARSSGTAISPYLKSLLGTIGNSAQIVMAFDLEDVFHSSGLKEKLKDAKALKDARVDLAELTRTLEGLRGAQLRINVTSDIEGELRLDLSSSAEPLRVVGKALVLEVLDHIGADLEDLDKWNPSVEGNTFVLKGKLDQASARLLLSPVDNRASRQAYLESQSEPTAKLDATAMATIEYYRSLTSLLEDIAPGKKTKANSTENRTFYYKQYAAKLDSLPILNVDPGLVQFGQALALTLRNLSRLSSMTKSAYENALAQYRTDFAMNTVSGYYGGGYGGYGGYGSYGGGWSYSAYAPTAINVDNFMDVRNMMASTAQNSQALREQTWINIKQSMQTVRQQLVTKYKTEV
jgi:hypothetical protein